MTKEFDLVLFGATGATGHRAAAYLSDRAPASLRWAAAGRDRVRLEELGLGVPLLVADSRDPVQLDNLAGKTRAVLNMAGPFRLYGDSVVEACIRQHTHYCDISGETARIRDLIDRHHARSAARQLKIIPFCGASSVPVDVAVTLLAARLGGTRPIVKAALRLQGGSFGAGTIASIGEAVTSGDTVREADPFLLGPADRRPKPMERDPRGVHYDRDLRAWTIFSPLGVSDTRAVRRSAALSGRDIVYQEYLAFDSLVQAVATWSALAGFRKALRWQSTRSILGRLASPDGTGQARKPDEGSYDLRVIGTSAAGQRLGIQVHGDGDTGNRITVLCACECALALVTHESDLPDIFGVLTPSIALGDALTNRLRAAGMTIEPDFSAAAVARHRSFRPNCIRKPGS